MGRKSGFTDEDVFVWLADHLATAPGVTVQQASKGTKVSVGSIYHRFGSMEDLLAEAWVWAHRKYRETVQVTLELDGLAGGLRSAVRALRFAHTDSRAAVLMYSVSKRFLVRSGISARVQDMVVTEEAAMDAAINDYAQRFGVDAMSVELGIFQIPKAIAQKYLPGGDIPAAAEGYARKSCRAILNNPLQTLDEDDS